MREKNQGQVLKRNRFKIERTKAGREFLVRYQKWAECSDLPAPESA